jgi:hypothetical protein
MSLADVAKIRELESRIEALEHARGQNTTDAATAARRAQSEALKAEIAERMTEHPGAKAFAIRSYLTRDPLPSLRRVQQVMESLKRTNGGIAPSADAPITTCGVK